MIYDIRETIFDNRGVLAESFDFMAQPTEGAQR
jgi:hypothetical protein